MDLISGRRFVLTQGFLYTFGGSEIVTLELAEHLVRHGGEVIVVTHGYSEQLAAELAEEARLLRYTDPDLADVLAERPIDVAWIHHQLVPDALLRKPGHTAFVFEHLSSFHALEHPFAYRIEQVLADAVLFTSDEAMRAQLATGLLDDVPGEKLFVMGNPAPDSFAGLDRDSSDALRRVVIVSNHLPDEVLGAASILARQYEVEFIGIEQDKGAAPARVSPETLRSADVVVTIGKTVQYCLVSGTPVYCYDHFGGPGWLTAESFDRARSLNFSGRGFATKSAEQIATEITEGFEIGRQIAQDRRGGSVESFGLTGRVAHVLELIGAPSGKPSTLDHREVEAHILAQRAFGTYVVMAFEHAAAHTWWKGEAEAQAEKAAWLESEVQALSETRSVLEARVAELDLHVGDLEKRNHALAVRGDELAEDLKGFLSRLVELEQENAELRSAHSQDDD